MWFKRGLGEACMSVERNGCTLYEQNLSVFMVFSDLECYNLQVMFMLRKLLNFFETFPPFTIGNWSDAFSIECHSSSQFLFFHKPVICTGLLGCLAQEKGSYHHHSRVRWARWGSCKQDHLDTHDSGARVWGPTSQGPPPGLFHPPLHPQCRKINVASSM